MALAKSPCTGDAGFSLIEVLAAMVILSVALMGLAQLFAFSTRANFRRGATPTWRCWRSRRWNNCAGSPGVTTSSGCRSATTRPTRPPAAGRLGLHCVCGRRGHGPVAVALGHAAAEQRRVGDYVDERLHLAAGDAPSADPVSSAAGPWSRCPATRTTP